MAHSVEEAQRELRSGDYNTVVIDPLSIGLEPASDLIFSVMNALQEIVFVLFVDSTEVDGRRADFFSGKRDETRPRITPELSAKLDRAISLVAPREPVLTPRRTVFLSHRFAESEYVDSLTRLLKKEGFTVSVGSPANTYVSQAILQRISEADYFVCLMTRDKEKIDGNYTTSPWLLEEKGAALALKKPVVLLIEHGVDEFGGLQGDWQRIHFSPKGYLNAALQSIGQLNSYAGS